MLLKTHYSITAFFVLLLIPAVEHKIIFVVTAFIATQLPDIDARYSKLGSKKIARILQWFTKHRGMIHSFTFLLSLTIVISLLFPIAALGFFLGYGLHLFADSFTPDGIRPFYPSKKTSSWKIRTGGKIEKIVLGVFVVGDVLLLLQRIRVLTIF